MGFPKWGREGVGGCGGGSPTWENFPHFSVFYVADVPKSHMKGLHGSPAGVQLLDTSSACRALLKFEIDHILGTIFFQFRTCVPIGAIVKVFFG